MSEAKHAEDDEVKPQDLLAKVLEDPKDDATMYEAKKQFKLQQKELDYDSNLLKNRVAHLRAELTKAQKKVSDTTTRAQEVAQLKKNQQLRKLIKQKTERTVLSAKQVQAREMKTKFFSSRQQAAKSREGAELQRKLAVNEFKEQKELLRKATEARQKTKRDERARRIAKQKEGEKRKRIERRQQEDQDHQDRLDVTRKQWTGAKEENIQLQKEVERLEEEEMKWIEKLRATQEGQREAYRLLERALEETAVTNTNRVDGGESVTSGSNSRASSVH